jgi:hypothetical protein
MRVYTILTMKKYLIASLLFLPAIYATDSQIGVKIDILCPVESPEYLAFINAVPKESSSPEDWRDDFTKSMMALIELVQSGKIRKGHWTANCQPEESISGKERFDPPVD